VPEQDFVAARDAGYASDVRWHVRKDGSRVFIEGSSCARHEAQTCEAFDEYANAALTNHETHVVRSAKGEDHPRIHDSRLEH
jgi:hypothetical protein